VRNSRAVRVLPGTRRYQDQFTLNVQVSNIRFTSIRAQTPTLHFNCPGPARPKVALAQFPPICSYRQPRPDLHRPNSRTY
jgi:hypothetical protein